MKASVFFRTAHKWLALIVGLQLLIWSFSGLYMTAVNIEIIHGDHLVKENVTTAIQQEPLSNFASQKLNALLDNNKKVVSVSIVQTPLAPEIQIKTKSSLVRVNPATAKQKKHYSKSQIIELANFYYAGDANIKSVQLLEKYPAELGGANRSIWQVEYDDWLVSRLYFVPETGELKRKRTDLWRLFDFFWMLHILDFDTRENVNNNLLTIAITLSVLLVIAGFSLLILRLKSGLKRGNSFRAKLQWLHKVVLIVVSLQVLIWIVSGLAFNLISQQGLNGKHLVKSAEVKYFNKAQIHNVLQKLMLLSNKYSKANKVEAKVFNQNLFYFITDTSKQTILDNQFHLAEIANKKIITKMVKDIYLGEGKLQSIELEKSRTTENRKYKLPVWRANFASDNNESIYFNQQGELLGVKTDRWRWFDFFWMLHIMDYTERENFNNGLVIFAALLKLIVCLSGILLLYFAFSAPANPYKQQLNKA